MDIKAILESLLKIRDLASLIIGETATLKRLKSDFVAYFEETAAGVSIPWCQGTLTKNADGAAIYLLPDGRNIRFRITSDLFLLYGFPEVKAVWDRDYPGAYAFLSAETILALTASIKALIDAGAVNPPPLPVPPPLPPPSTGKLVWLTSKSEVLTKAQAEGKKILLLAGRENCSVTTGMRDFACELSTPPIKSLIERYFVPWFIDTNRIPGDVQYYAWYLPGVQTYNMPLIAVIDPANIQGFLDRSYGNQKFQSLYNWMLKYTPAG